MPRHFRNSFLALLGLVVPAIANTGDIIVGRSDGDNMRWAAYRWDGVGPTPNYFLLGTEQGHAWGPNRSATAIASGDIDNDGHPEVVVGRDGHGPGGNMRWQAYRVFDDEIVPIGDEQGHGWGDDRGVSSMTIGDLNGDGAEDVVIGRSDGENMRWAAYVWDSTDGFVLLGSEQGGNWGPDRSATALAVGNLDGTGNLDVVVGRDGHGPGGNMRWQAFTLTGGDFLSLGPEQGGGWGDSRGVSAIVVADVDGDGIDEVVVGRSPGDNMRWAVFGWDGATFQLFGSEQGHNWGDDRGVSALASGDVDGDGNDEIAVGRTDGENMRWAVYQWNGSDLELLGSEQGHNWGSSRSAASLAIGDIDGDGRDDVLVGRDGHGPGGNMRWHAFRLNNTATDFEPIGPEQGTDWGDDRGASAVAVVIEDVDTDGDGLLDRWETSGIPGTSPPLTTNPLHKDLFWEFDWATPADAPTSAQITALKNAFAAAPPDSGGMQNPDNQPGITLWIDTGGVGGGDNLGGGGLVNSPLDFSGLTSNFYDVKDAAFDKARRATFRYALLAPGPSNNSGTSTGGNSPTILNDTTQSWLEDEWGGRTVTITAGTAMGEACVVQENSGSQLVIADCSPLPRWAQTPAAGTPYTIIGTGVSGTTSAGSTATTLVDNTQAWTANAFQGTQVRLDGGAFPENTCTITSNTATQLTISTCLGLDTWATLPDNTSTYSVSGIGGQAELGGNDMIEFNHNAATLMHEMGHNLNLQHGGDTDTNCKVNYVSVMNYDHQVAFPGATQVGIPQVGGGVIIDFSPPLIGATSQRGLPVPPPINELNLVEPTILDPSDFANRAVYTNINGRKTQVTRNQAVNWNSDMAGDPPNEGPFQFNTDIPDSVTGTPNCGESGQSLGFLESHDDWSNIVLPIDTFGDSEDSAVNPVLDPEPTLEEQQLLGQLIATTDLSITKMAEPVVAVAGWDKVTYTLGIRNNGPNPADQAQLSESLPTDVVPDLVPDICSEGGPGLVCALEPLNAADDVTHTIRVFTSAEPVFAAGHSPVASVNQATVATTLGPDPIPSNDSASASVALVGAVGNWISFSGRGLSISDQFGKNAQYVDPRPQAIIAPAAVDGEPAPRLDGVHLAAYHLTPLQPAAVNESVLVDSRFGAFEGRATGPARFLLVPTGKSLSAVPKDVDTVTQSVPHYACYDIELKVSDNDRFGSIATTDQFVAGRQLRVRLRDGLLCNPAEKNGEVIPNPAAPHLLCFDNASRREREKPVLVTLRNQFGDHRATIEMTEKVCVAASKKHIEEAGRPDLTIEPVLPEPPSSALQGFPGFEHCLRPRQGGASRRITLFVRNLATEPAGASTVSVAFGDRPTIATAPVRPLGAGEREEVQFQIPNGCFTGSGASTCRFRMVADSEDILQEANESNNVKDSFCVQPTG